MKKIVLIFLFYPFISFSQNEYEVEILPDVDTVYVGTEVCFWYNPDIFQFNKDRYIHWDENGKVGGMYQRLMDYSYDSSLEEYEDSLKYHYMETYTLNNPGVSFIYVEVGGTYQGKDWFFYTGRKYVVIEKPKEEN